MVAITATNSATPALQAPLSRARVAQAQREADQAEANAKNLRAQADDAEQQAQKSQDHVRQVADRVQQDQATYSMPRDASTTKVPLQVQKLVEQMYSETSALRAQSDNSLKTNVHAQPVVNSQGQATGRIVNISA